MRRRTFNAPPEWLLVLLIVLGACAAAVSRFQIQWHSAYGTPMYWRCPRCGPVELQRVSDRGDGKGPVCSRCGSDLY